MWSWYNDCKSILISDGIIEYNDIYKNPPHEIIGISFEQYIDSLDEFREKKFSSLLPNEIVLNWFMEKGYRFRHVALSAVPRKAAHISSQWVIKHFGHWIRTYSFIPSPRGERDSLYDQNKYEYLKWLNKADIFIDDNERNFKHVSKLGIKPIIFPQPWNNQNKSIHEILDDIEK